MPRSKIMRPTAHSFDDLRTGWHRDDDFQDGEVPVYGTCERCTDTIRIDRHDLVEQHRQICNGR